MFGVLLVTAVWLVGAGFVAAWWTGDAVGWATIWEAMGAAALAFWAIRE